MGAAGWGWKGWGAWWGGCWEMGQHCGVGTGDVRVLGLWRLWAVRHRGTGGEVWDRRGGRYMGTVWVSPQAQERVQGLETEAEQLRGELVQRQQQGQTWEQEKVSEGGHQRPD